MAAPHNGAEEGSTTRTTIHKGEGKAAPHQEEAEHTPKKEGKGDHHFTKNNFTSLSSNVV